MGGCGCLFICECVLCVGVGVCSYVFACVRVCVGVCECVV